MSSSNDASSSASSSLLAEVTRRKLAHRAGGRWATEAEWSRHRCADRFGEYATRTLEQLGSSAEAHTYETAADFLAHRPSSNSTDAPLASIPRILGSSLTPSVFHSSFEARSLPCVISGLAEEWQMREWTIGELEKEEHDLAGVRFKVDEQLASNSRDADSKQNGDAAQESSTSVDAAADHECDPPSDTFKLPLHSFMVYLHHNTDDCPLYVFDGVFDCEPLGPRILSSYTPPSLFSSDLFALLGELRRPPYRWILIGPERSGSAAHTDPLATAAWNTCVDGIKQWVLFPPGTDRSHVKGSHLISDEYLTRGGFSSRDSMSEEDVADAMEAVHYFTECLPRLCASTSSSAPHGMVTFLQYPGDTVFVPHGWLHAVLNLTPTVAVTQNYVSPRNFREAWTDCRRKRPHLSERWREQLQRHEPHLAELAVRLDAEEPLRSLPAFSPAADRRPDVDWMEAREDAESWYWNLSSEDEDEEEEDESYALGTNAAATTTK